MKYIYIYIIYNITIINYISIIHQLQFNLTTLNKTAMSQNYGETLESTVLHQGCYNVNN